MAGEPRHEHARPARFRLGDLGMRVSRKARARTARLSTML